MKLVSLVPSLTETIAHIGLKENLVGITQFCMHPPGLQRKSAIVGGTKDPNITEIARLKPTHILTNEEENKPEHIRQCQAIAPTLVTFPRSPYEVPSMLEDMRRFLSLHSPLPSEVDSKIVEMIKSLRREFEELDACLSSGTRQSFAYLIWRNPYMVVGLDTYISKSLELAGMRNVYYGEERYPQITVEDLQKLSPDVLFLSSEPYPFRRRDGERLREELLSESAIPRFFWIDGRVMSWYGYATLELVPLLRQIKVSNWRATGLKVF